MYDRLTEIVEAYRETGQAMSVTRLAELYIFDAMLRDGYGNGHPTNAAVHQSGRQRFCHVSKRVLMRNLSSVFESSAGSCC